MNEEKSTIEKGQLFDPNHSELELHHEMVSKYVQLLEEELGHGFKIEGILEIGSYAKGEAVPGSDIDTRVFVSSPDSYIWQTSGSRLSDARQTEAEQKFSNFLQTSPQKNRFNIDWYEFNEPTSKRICQQLGINVEFGLADSSFAAYELQRLDTEPTAEHQFLLESNIVYDPHNFLRERRQEIDGKVFPPLVRLYQERYLNALPFEIYTHLQSHEFDSWKLEKSHQIQWIKWAVRSIRDAVGTKWYIQNGKLLYKKQDILDFCSAFLPSEDIAVIKELYLWKTDPEIREKMVSDFVAHPDTYFTLFGAYTKKLETIVQRIKHL